MVSKKNYMIGLYFHQLNQLSSYYEFQSFFRTFMTQCFFFSNVGSNIAPKTTQASFSSSSSNTLVFPLRSLDGRRAFPTRTRLVTGYAVTVSKQANDNVTCYITNVVREHDVDHTVLRRNITAHVKTQLVKQRYYS